MPKFTTQDRYGFEFVGEGRILSSVVGASVISVNEGECGSDEAFLADMAVLSITTSAGELIFYHTQSCCENVYLESPGVDEIRDAIVGGTIVVCEARSSDAAGKPESCDENDSWTWTFYEIRTTKGDVTLRFLGVSNGYYSESVDVAFIPKGE